MMYYAESAEFMCGYYLIECRSKQRAIELAAQMPEARFTGIEVRPVVFSTATGE
jgi:hypothetical protein